MSEASDIEEYYEIEGAIERIKSSLENRKKSHVLFLGPFIDGWHDILQHAEHPELWHNHQARSEENCENFEFISHLGRKNYDQMAYCQSGKCPFYNQCKATGFLHHYEKRFEKPITYARHQNLVMEKDYRLLVFDEDPTGTFERMLKVSESDLNPASEDWYVYLPLTYPDGGQEKREALEDFVSAVKRLMQNPSVLSGYRFVEALDESCRGKLGYLLSQIDDDLINTYQRRGGGDAATVEQAKALPNRYLPDLIRLVKAELAYYEDGVEFYNTRISLLGNHIYLHFIDVPEIPKSKPIIVADGTAEPALYEAAFKREVSVYQPEIYSPLATTTVFYGSDFTITSVVGQLAEYYSEDREDLGGLEVEDMFGNKLKLSDLPEEPNNYGSSAVTQIVTVLKSVASKHKSLLFVTHKKALKVIEDYLRVDNPELYQRVAFRNYRSLRGTNRYQDYEAVMLVGVPRIPYNILHQKAQAWAWEAGYKKYISPNIVIKQAPYHGREEGYSYVTFDDPFADMLVRVTEEGEIRQCLDRIRPFTSDVPKHVYLLMGRPAARWVSRLKSVKQEIFDLNSSVRSKAMLFMRAWKTEYGEFPAFKDVKEYVGGASRRVIARWRDELSETMMQEAG